MLTNSQSLIIMDMYAAGAILCMIGGLFIVLTYVPLRVLHTPTSTIIFFLGLADLFLGISNLSSYFIRNFDGPDMLCVAQAAGTQFFAVCSFMWRACFSYHAYAALCQQKSREDLQSYIKYYFLLCVFLPLLIMAACIELNAFGPTEEKHLYCWITSDQVALRFAFYYIPLVCIWLFNIVIYILLSKQLKSLLTYEHLINKQRRKLRLYLLAFIVFKMPALVNRILNAAAHQTIFELFLIQAICDGMLGLADAVIYAYTNRIVYVIMGLRKEQPRYSNASSHSSEHSINASTEPLLHDFPPYANSISERLLLKQHRTAL